MAQRLRIKAAEGAGKAWSQAGTEGWGPLGLLSEEELAWRERERDRETETDTHTHTKRESETETQ